MGSAQTGPPIVTRHRRVIALLETIEAGFMAISTPPWERDPGRKEKLARYYAPFTHQTNGFSREL